MAEHLERQFAVKQKHTSCGEKSAKHTMPYVKYVSHYDFIHPVHIFYLLTFFF